MMPTTAFDARFSDPAAEPRPWEETLTLLREAELYWLSSVRADGRPHVTPLIGVWHDGGLCVVTGTGEQKAHNLERNAAVAVTTGRNRWADGTDVVVEGRAVRTTGTPQLTAVAEAFVAKYGEVWRFEPRDGGFGSPGGLAWVLRVRPAKVLAFAKDPHGQTTYRFSTA